MSGLEFKENNNLYFFDEISEEDSKKLFVFIAETLFEEYEKYEKHEDCNFYDYLSKIIH